MPLREEKCPNCGTPLKVLENKTTVKCPKCGRVVAFAKAIKEANLNQFSSKILIDKLINEALDKKAKENVENLFILAESSEQSDNPEEAYGYYKKILEIDSKNSLAWLRKGEIAGMLSTFEKPRLSEMITCFRRTVEFTPPDMMDEIVEEVVSMINLYIEYYVVFPKEEVNYKSEEDIWEYRGQLYMVLEALDFAHQSSPRDEETVKNIIQICKNNLEGISYEDPDDLDENGFPKVKTQYPDDENKAKLSERMELFIEKMREINSDYKPYPIEASETPVTTKQNSGCSPILFFLVFFIAIYLIYFLFK